MYCCSGCGRRGFRAARFAPDMFGIAGDRNQVMIIVQHFNVSVRCRLCRPNAYLCFHKLRRRRAISLFATACSSIIEAR